MGLGRLSRVLLGNSLLLAGYCLRVWVMTDTTMIDRLTQFVESEMRSCSMDMEALLRSMCVGCGEGQWLLKILPLRWKTYLGFKIDSLH